MGVLREYLGLHTFVGGLCLCSFFASTKFDDKANPDRLEIVGTWPDLYVLDCFYFFKINQC